MAVSNELDNEGKAIATLEKLPHGGYKATARTFGAVNILINFAGEYKLAEMKRCLEGQLNLS